jgi:hypothetical protein
MERERRRERQDFDLAVRLLHQHPSLAEAVVQRVVIPVDTFPWQHVVVHCNGGTHAQRAAKR